MGKKAAFLLLAAAILLLPVTAHADPADFRFDDDCYSMTVEREKRSGAVQVSIVDPGWNITPATGTVTLSLAARVYDSTTWEEVDDTSAVFYDKNGDQAEGAVTIAAGETGTAFSFKTSTTAAYVYIYVTSSLNPGMSRMINARLLSGGITGAGLTKEGDYTTAGSSFAVMGNGETAYIDFGVPETDISWQVIIASSTDFSNPLWAYYGGWGIPQYHQVSWSGDVEYYDAAAGYTRSEKAQKGTYYVRIILGHGSASVKDDSLSIRIDSPEIWGTVKDGSGNGLGEAYISAYGPTCAYTMSDKDGNYRLAGLQQGAYYIYVNKYGYTFKNFAGIEPGELNVVLSKPSYLKVNARRELSSSPEVGNPERWVSVSIHDAEYSSQYYAMFHFGVGISTSDNGNYYSGGPEPVYEHVNSTDSIYSGGRWTFVDIAPGTYTLEAELFGYTPVSKTVVVAEGAVVTVDDIVFNLKKTVYGTVTLPAAVSDAGWAWVSIEAIKKGDRWATSWGSAQIEVGRSSAAYAVYGLDAGTYTLRARLPGFQKAEQTKYVSNEAETFPDLALGSGGTLSGTVTIEGDTGDPALGLSDPIHLYLNAWSPDTYAYGWKQVDIATSAASASGAFSLAGLEDGTYWVSTWLNGFEMEGAVGWSGVKAVVSGGSGTLNVKLKRYSGRIRTTVTKPSGGSYGDIKVYLEGGTFWDADWASTGVPLLSTSAASNGGSFDPATGALVTPPLGTGAYRIKAVYAPNGLERSKYVMVTNARESAAELDLSGNTYAVSGKVKIDQAAPPERITDIAVLVDSVAAHAVNLRGVPGVENSTTTFRVFAVDYTKLQTMQETNPETGMVNLGNVRSGLINADGSYTVSGLVPGVYMLVIPGVELDETKDGCETAPVEKRVLITTASVTVDDISIRKGYAIRGTVKLPDGFQPAAGTAMSLRLRYADKKRITKYSGGGVWVTLMGPTAPLNFDVTVTSRSYEINGLCPGEYALSIKEIGTRQFANATAVVKVSGSDVNGKNIQLSRGGKIKFKLRDADSSILITPRNRDKMLPWSYGISAMASPWVEGGWFAYENTGDAMSRDSFELPFLPEGNYDLVLGQSQYGLSGGAMPTAGTNETSYAAKTVTGVKMKDGLTADLGTIDIRQGLTITGTITNAAGQGLPNIPVIAVPSLGSGWSAQLRGFTDINGVYSIVGLDPDNIYYDVIACPRVDPRLFGDYFFFGNGGLTYGEKTRSMVRIAADTPSVDFVLSEAKGAVAGTVRTEDGGVFQNPGDLNVPTAKVFLQAEDTFPRTNPIGDIVADTAIDGSFTVEALPAGSYRIVILSGGYASYSTVKAVGDAKTDLGTITLKRGARIAGRIAKPDGKSLSTEELRSVTAATDDLSELLIGSLVLSGDRTVTGYELNGMQAGSSYNIMFLSGEEELIPAALGYSVPFSSYTKTDYNLTFQPSAPAVFTRARKSGSAFTVYFELTGALRNTIPADRELEKIITAASGTGSVSDRSIAPDRKSLMCTYTPPSGEDTFTLRLRAFSKTVNPATGAEFEVNEAFQYYVGAGAQNRVRISNLRGGRVSLEGDSSSVNFGPGAFDTNSSTSIYIDFIRAEDFDSLKSAPGRGARFALPRPARAYPPQIFQAVKLAQSAGVDPFSSFYQIMLPAGVSNVLKKDATLTLQYAAGADPSTLNIYYYDPVNNVYLLENRNRRSSAADRTISASINHASTFVILQANASVIQGTAYSGPLFVYNYPNPFDLSVKPVVLANAPAAQQNRNIPGTMIHYGLPADMSGEVEIRIYNVAGELVRTINDGLRSGGSHYYTEWNGANDSGNKAASGVYVGRFTVDKKHEKFFKMAIIK